MSDLGGGWHGASSDDGTWEEAMALILKSRDELEACYNKAMLALKEQEAEAERLQAHCEVVETERAARRAEAERLRDEAIKAEAENEKLRAEVADAVDYLQSVTGADGNLAELIGWLEWQRDHHRAILCKLIQLVGTNSCTCNAKYVVLADSEPELMREGGKL